MNTEQLQFVFSLFSLVGIIGVLFYIILERAKKDALHDKIETLEGELKALKDYMDTYKNGVEAKSEPQNIKEKIIALYEKGLDIIQIENHLNVPRAKVEMVIKFHNLNKADNWRETVNNNL